MEYLFTLTKNFIEKHPAGTSGLIGALLVSAAIVGLSGTFWAGVLAFGVFVLMITVMINN